MIGQYFSSWGKRKSAPVVPVVETVLSVNEMTLVKVPQNQRSKRFVRHGCFRNERTGLLYPFGSFDTPSVQDLRNKVASLQETAATAATPKPPGLVTRSGVDIAELQGTLSTKDCAMVQVASNFNCLENSSRRTDPSRGSLVDTAFWDCTQGPAAVFGTLSAYLYRCHFYKGGQTAQSGVNLLENASQYFGTPEIGKLTLTGREEVLKTEADVDAAAAKVCVGLHQDCPIMFGRSNGRTITVIDGTKNANEKGEMVLEFPLVDQVLSSSINLRDYGSATFEELEEHERANLMRSLLRAAYEGIYLAAILRQRKKLYLTLVGGGSFRNPIGLVVEEIHRAHRMWSSHPASKLEECVICLYSQNDEKQVKAAMNALKGETEAPTGGSS